MDHVNKVLWRTAAYWRNDCTSVTGDGGGPETVALLGASMPDQATHASFFIFLFTLVNHKETAHGQVVFLAAVVTGAIPFVNEALVALAGRLDTTGSACSSGSGNGASTHVTLAVFYAIFMPWFALRAENVGISRWVGLAVSETLPALLLFAEGYMRIHSSPQILAGVAMGLTAALAFFTLCELVRFTTREHPGLIGKLRLSKFVAHTKAA